MKKPVSGSARMPHVAAVPWSAVPELRRALLPFLGGDAARDHVVMVRLAETAVVRLDELVEAGLFGSRSEAAAFLVGAGIRSQRSLFDRIASQSAEIRRMRKAIRQTALQVLRGGARTQGGRRARRRRSGR